MTPSKNLIPNLPIPIFYLLIALEDYIRTILQILLSDYPDDTRMNEPLIQIIFALRHILTTYKPESIPKVRFTDLT